MPIKLSSFKYSVETETGHALVSIAGDGIHVQQVTDKDGRIIIHDDMAVSFHDVIDLAAGQHRLIK